MGVIPKAEIPHNYLRIQKGESMKAKKYLIILTAMIMVLCSVALVHASASAEDGTPDKGSAAVYATDITGLFDQYLKGVSYEGVKCFEENDEVNAIITLEGESVLAAAQKRNMSVSAYLQTEEGARHEESLFEIQRKALDQMTAKGIGYTVKYSYTTLLNGLAVKVKYGQLKAIEGIAVVSDAALSEFYALPSSVEDVTEIKATVNTASNSDYNGDGMLVAVIDTGLQVNHEAFSVMPENQKISKEDIEAALENLTAKNGYRLLANGQEYDVEYLSDVTADDLYKNGKVPFGFDYCDVDAEVAPSLFAVQQYGLDHGTHVAGIVAGNNGSDFKGVAYNAQIAVLKVFGDGGDGAYDVDILAAISDSIVLGADVVNMSLGSGAGFTDAGYFAPYYEAAEEAGLVLSVAAGNDYFLGKSGIYDGVPASNIEFGVIGASSTYAQSFAVASLDSYKTIVKYIGFNDGKLEYNEVPEKNFINDILGENERVELTYVPVPNVGAPEDYEGLEVSGKIALVQRGTISFEEKFNNAKAAGAIACIVYDNVEGNYVNMQMTGEVIPGCFIKLADGERLLAAENKTLVFDKSYYSDYGYQMSDFSSWGCTPSLNIKPEITGFGGYIYSSVVSADTNKYDYMSGTSMAAPYVSGQAVLARQFVNEKFPELSSYEKGIMVRRLLMNTAEIIIQEGANPYSPRKQGAGLASIENLVKTTAYVTVPDMTMPKIELGHDPEMNGVYVLEMNVTNFGETELTYVVNPIVMCEALGAPAVDGQAMFALKDYRLNPEIVVDGHADSKITVAAGETVSVKVTVILSESDIEYLGQFEYGNFVEGFVVFENEETTNLSVPFLGFYGDWTKAPIFDTFIYDDEQATIGWGFIGSEYGTGYYPLGYYSYKTQPGVEVPLYNVDKMAFGGNVYGRSYAKSLDVLAIYMRRNAGKMHMIFEDADTGDVIYETTQILSARKSFSNNGGNPTLRGYQYNFSGFDYIPFGAIPSNTRIRISVDAELDFPGEKNTEKNSLEFYVTADYEAPVVLEEGLGLYEKDGKLYLDVPVYDNHYIMAGQLMECNEYGYATTNPLEAYPTPAYQTERGNGEYTFTFDMTNYYDKIKNGKVAFAVVDYACNDKTYVINLDLTEINPPTKVEFTQDSIDVDINQVLFDLPIYTDIPFAIPTKTDWESSDPSIVKVDNGALKGISHGTATVTFYRYYGEVMFTDSIEVNVSETVAQDEYTPQWFDLYLNGEKLLDGKSSYGRGQIKTYNLPYSVDYKVGDVLKFEVVPYPWYACEDVELSWLGSTGTLWWGYDREYGDRLTYVVNEEGVADLSEENTIKLVKEGYTIVRMLAVKNTYGAPYCDFWIHAVAEGEPDGEISIDDVTLDINQPLDLVLNQNGNVVKPDRITISGGDETIAKAYYEEEYYVKDGNVIYGKQGTYKTTLVGMKQGSTTFDAAVEYTVNGEKKVYNTTVNVTVTDTEVHKVHPDYILLTYEGYTWGRHGRYTDNSEMPIFDVVIGREYEAKYEVYPAYACDDIQIDWAPRDDNGNKVVEIVSAENGVLKFKWSGLREGRGDISFSSVHYDEYYKVPALPQDSFRVDFCINFRMNAIDEDGLIAPPLPPEDQPIFDIRDGVLWAYNGTDPVVVIPDGVTSIIGGALNARSTKVKLEKVVVPYGVTEIGAYAFQNQDQMKEIVLPYSLLYIGRAAFDSCGIETLEIPHSVEEMDIWTFQNCFNLKSVVIGSRLKEIPYSCFDRCRKLTDVKIYAGVTTISRYAFQYCPIEELTLPETIKKVDNEAFVNSGIKSIKMPYVEVIDNRAFYNCENLTNVEFGDKLTTIGEDAFTYCALTEVTIPKSVKRLGNQTEMEEGTFAYNRITKVVFEDGIQLESRYQSEYGDSYENYGTYTGIIPIYMFRDNPITDLYIPDSITTVGSYAFYNCPMTGEIHWGGITKIGQSAFGNSSISGEFAIPEGITDVCASAFVNTSITKVYIPASLTYASLVVGRGCIVNPDAEIVIAEGNELWQVEDGVLYSGTTLVRPFNNLYNGEKVFRIKDGTRRIETGAFSNCKYEIIVVPASVERIGAYAFEGVNSVYFEHDEAPVLEFWRKGLSTGNYSAIVAQYNNFKSGMTVYFKKDAVGFDEYSYRQQNVTYATLDLEAIIDELPEATLENEAAFVSAREAFELLSDSEKAEVGNYWKLLEGEKTILNLKYEAALARIAELEEQVKDLEAKNAEIETLNNKISELEAQIETLNAEIEKLNGEAETSAELIKTLEEAKASLENAKAELQKALDAAEEAKTAAEQGKADAEAKAAAAETAKAAAEAELATAKANVDALEAELESVKNELELLRKAINSSSCGGETEITAISVISMLLLVAGVAVLALRKKKNVK